MCCITLIAVEAAMATTELARNVNHVVGTPWLPKQGNGKLVRMNWVVVTENGKQRLRMNWDVAARDE
jgi:hypothetical protein